MLLSSMTKGKLKEEKQRKEKIVSDEDHYQKTRVKDCGKNSVEKRKNQNSTQSSMKVKHDDEEDCLDEIDSIKKVKKSRKDKYQITFEASGIATDKKEPKGKVGQGMDKSDRKLHKSTEEFVHEDSNCKENSNIGSSKKKKKSKEEKDDSTMLQSLEEMEQSVHKHDKKTKKSKKNCEEKSFREDNQEINMENVSEIVPNVDIVDNGKKKRKRKAEPESTLDTGNSENEDMEMLGSDHDKVSKETDFVKRKIKKKKSKDQSERQSKPVEHPGLDYLHTWYTNRQHWNFKKVRQIWLLQNIFDQEQISDEDFCILLKYLEGLKGAAKDKTIEMAEKRIESDTGDQDAVVESRVRQVLQLLTE